MLIPSLLLKKLYTLGSLKNTGGGVSFSIKNRLSDAELVALKSIAIDGQEVPLGLVTLCLADGRCFQPDQISMSQPLTFPLRTIVDIHAAVPPLKDGKHTLHIGFDSRPFGKLQFSVEDATSQEKEEQIRIPRDANDDYGDAVIKDRQSFVEQFSGKKLEHLAQYSFDPHIAKGNIEHFTGVAQVPIGFAGPITINGEQAKGDFVIPLATTEGTLVASYNRGIKVVNLCGGVKCTVIDDVMQRAPVFAFDDARGARDFVQWICDNFEKIKDEAEATSKVAKLKYIDPFLANKFAYLRFNFNTGDAAGQNMVGRATFAACSWIIDHYPGIRRFYLESNFATDKKASQINIMRTRGKRVTAEVVVKRDILIQQLRVEPEQLAYHHGVANVGAFLSGANNNGLHAANAITAMFIATGQDVANVSEASAGIIYTELTPDRDLYLSLTLPSLIVATYGGGTGLATQRECLEILGCYGMGKVHKFAEIVAGVALAGELSLASAISSLDWVSSHETYGRNR
ncbi:MAG: hydroxymethylglutaryl-CoA reductase [Anaerolineae bacterium]|jgi:hydroxymethylglutaryl-CoA reductase (NADPH)|nr:hydroxymethylglutaryl-CoA reductase [Anaerolineae bacterium]